MHTTAEKLDSASDPHILHMQDKVVRRMGISHYTVLYYMRVHVLIQCNDMTTMRSYLLILYYHSNVCM